MLCNFCKDMTLFYKIKNLKQACRPMNCQFSVMPAKKSVIADMSDIG